MEILQGIFEWVTTKGAPILLLIVAIEKVMQALDAILPKTIKVDNHIADVLGKIIKTLTSIVKRTP